MAFNTFLLLIRDAVRASCNDLQFFSSSLKKAE